MERYIDYNVMKSRSGRYGQKFIISLYFLADLQYTVYIWYFRFCIRILIYSIYFTYRQMLSNETIHIKAMKSNKVNVTV